MVRVSFTTMTCMTKKHLDRKGFIRCTLIYPCSSLKEVNTGTQVGENLEAGSDAQSIKEGVFLVVFSACFLTDPRTTHNELDHPPSITTNKMLTDLCTYQYCGGISLTEALLSDDFSLCSVGTKLCSTVLKQVSVSL